MPLHREAKPFFHVRSSRINLPYEIFDLFSRDVVNRELGFLRIGDIALVCHGRFEGLSKNVECLLR